MRVTVEERDDGHDLQKQVQHEAHEAKQQIACTRQLDQNVDQSMKSAKIETIQKINIYNEWRVINEYDSFLF